MAFLTTMGGSARTTSASLLQRTRNPRIPRIGPTVRVRTRGSTIGTTAITTQAPIAPGSVQVGVLWPPRSG